MAQLLELQKHEDDLRLSVADLAASGMRQLQGALDLTPEAVR